MPESGRVEKLVLWRAFVPRWAHDPLSGMGASRFGGRWNRVGESCLYAACELSTAWAEYNQGFVQHPATIVQMVLEDARLADLSRPDLLVTFGNSEAIHGTEWRADLASDRIPATHVLASRLREDGYDGLIYPSFMSRGGTCVALWRWDGPPGARLSVIDPEERLPKGPASWL